MRKSEREAWEERRKKKGDFGREKKLWLLCLMTNKSRRKLQKIAGVNY